MHHPIVPDLKYDAWIYRILEQITSPIAVIAVAGQYRYFVLEIQVDVIQFEV